MNHVGLDFLAHPFWDKYIEFEERMDKPDNIFAILTRLILIPMHQYARYFEKYRQAAQVKPLTSIAPATMLTQLQLDMENEGVGYKAGRSPAEVERDLRARIDTYHVSIFQKTQTETTRRWTYESEIKRPYFHVTELEPAQLENWRKYLDFEEAEPDNFVRVQFLYERCLVTCAHHEEFWLRYARWLSSFSNKEEEVRNIYQRASCIFVPIALPNVRLQYAYFEETHSRIDVAKAIHEAILIQLPSDIATIVSLANLIRRHDGLPAAISVYKSQLESPHVSSAGKSDLLAHWARLLSRVKNSYEEARQIFTKHQSSFLDSPSFWLNFLRFEIELPTKSEEDKLHYGHVRHVIDAAQNKGRIGWGTMQELMGMYMSYLLERGTKETVKEYMELDREVNGPNSVQKTIRSKVEEAGYGVGLGQGQGPGQGHGAANRKMANGQGRR